MKIQIKKVIVILSIVIGSLALIYLAGYILLFISLSNSPNLAYGEDLEYYDTIKAISKSNDEINLKEVFTFDWEKAYIVPTQSISGSELAKRIGVDCDLLPLDPHAPGLRIVFYNNDEVVYDYMYDSNYIKFEPLDQVISKESTVFVVEEKGKPIILRVKS